METDLLNVWKKRMKAGGVLLLIISLLISLLTALAYKYSFICYIPKYCN